MARLGRPKCLRPNTPGTCAWYDRSGRLHVVYDVGGDAPPARGELRLSTYFQTRGQLVHAVKEGRHWTISLIEEGWEGGIGAEFFDLFVDHAEQPHVSFRLGEQIYYATLKDGAWVSQSIARTDYFQSVALAVTGSCGHVLLRNSRCLVHVQGRLGSEWVSERVEHVDASYDLSVVVGPEQSLHLAYMRCAKSNDRAMYTIYADGEWSKPEMIERKANNGFGNQLAISGEGVPHLVYRIQKSRRQAGSTRRDAAQIRYAVRTGKKWTIHQVCPSAGWQCALALSAGEPWVAYASTRGDGITLANLHVVTLPDGNRYSARVEELLQRLGAEPVYLTDHGFNTALGVFPPRRFWEVQVDDCSCVIRHGLIGEEGVTETVEYDSWQAALGARERLLDRVHWGKEG